MKPFNSPESQRRPFLQEDLPKNTNPRTISGDTVEPDWEQRVKITVGPQQAAIGGDTVHILPGTYRLRNSIFLQSKVRIQGSGSDAVLVKEPSVTTELSVDGD